MNPAGSEPFGEAGAGAGFGGGAVVVGAGFGAGGGVDLVSNCAASFVKLFF
ncbi:hypothetical protein QVH35_06905 [Candidatus Nitrosotenuis chungbukensis]|uniref:hypothetical protein n=1 Tax=Candidatus Nitrosotenuis chungbukensis TaxID=1353246 RepID=UPI002672231F|nr:hypothetical protein [Candidatus Nitrosotenuis chungbukensis]WKT57166.1 hypothetical protein QVH35_06905 [Candidatus Nitrosotenuis chungbukensis]